MRARRSALLGRVLVGAVLAAAAHAQGAADPVPSEEAPFGFRTWETDAPLSIESDELEAVQREGARTLVFTRNVRVAQADLRIRCRKLEAFYPAGSTQPDRLVARGDVVIVQGGQQASCREAVYERVKEQLRCSGDARFVDGDNELTGEAIEIDLRNETVKVTGGARILLQSEPDAGEEAP